MFSGAPPSERNPDPDSTVSKCKGYAGNGAKRPLQGRNMLDFPITPPILVKDTPRHRRIETINQPRAFVADALAFRRTAPWRELRARLDGAKTETDAIEAIGALRELLMTERLLASSSSSHL